MNQNLFSFVDEKEKDFMWRWWAINYREFYFTNNKKKETIILGSYFTHTNLQE